METMVVSLYSVSCGVYLDGEGNIIEFTIFTVVDFTSAVFIIEMVLRILY